MEKLYNNEKHTYKMNIIIPTIGTRGDVQPYIALALELQKTGHSVILATHPCLGKLVRSYGVPFSAIGPDIDLDKETVKIRGKSSNWILGFLRTMRFTFDILEKSHQDILELCKQANLVIVSHSAAGSIEADMLHLPTVSVTLTPQAIPVNDPKQSWFIRKAMKTLGGLMDLFMIRKHLSCWSYPT